ncbi:hypothetical protein BKK50_11220 [Rodentibacter rarus]|uniref:Uncharacterized protein n=1 Tax=Rodentibacter rarus TaxID=1908260 RepID=A0A1V3IF31_9PAST|nr:hypothetical protein [Rodentibacter rarus]OOF38992.1 hypothetical protein BKK50_11220 [Rodentibacter rarus]
MSGNQNGYIQIPLRYAFKYALPLLQQKYTINGKPTDSLTNEKIVAEFFDMAEQIQNEYAKRYGDFSVYNLKD